MEHERKGCVSCVEGKFVKICMDTSMQCSIRHQPINILSRIMHIVFSGIGTLICCQVI